MTTCMMSSNRQNAAAATTTTNHSQPPNQLRIAYWNAAGISNKIIELECFMQRHKIDIMMIIETRISATSNLNINGYLCYLVSNPNSYRSGGVAILVRHGIRHAALETIATNCVQCAPIVIYTSFDNRNAITISPIYCPPTFNWTGDHFRMLFAKLASLTQGTQFLVCGDWNAKHGWWGNRRSCRRGRTLLETIQRSHSLHILATGGATHYPFNRRNQPSAIDFAIYSDIPPEALHSYSTVDLHSDHLPVHVHLSVSCLPPSQANRQLLPVNADIQIFQRCLDDSIHVDTELNSGDDIEDAIKILNENIYAAAASATPPPRPIQLRNAARQFQLSDATMNLIQLKRQCKRNHMRLHTDATRQLYRRAENRLKKALKLDRAKVMNAQLEQVDTTDRYRMQKLWRITNRLKRQPELNWPLKLQANSNSPPVWTKSCQEKAEAFANHLEERFSPNLSNTDANRLAVSSELEQLTSRSQQQQQQQHPLQQQASSPPFTTAEIQEEIDALEPKKSAGWDNINNIVLKRLPTKAIQYLGIIFNSILRCGHFPQQWKLATISMILKPGKSANDVSSYRPISLLSSFSKLFEKLLMRRLFDEEGFCQAIPNHQFGFRREHGTDQQLFRVTQFILKAFEDRQVCSAVYIDISEAFDRVWHDGLKNKLIKLLPSQLYDVLQSYLTGRQFLVKGLNGVKSRTCQIRAGVPQGSVLGPILYNIFTSDMPLADANNDYYKQLLSTYADDTVILTAAPTAIQAVGRNQAYLRRLEKWAKLWCIKINASKTAHVIHTLRRLVGRESNLTIKLNASGNSISNSSNNSNVVVNTTRHKYLGVYLDSKLKLIHHITQLCIRVKALAKKFSWLIGRQSKLSKKCKMLIYKQLIAPTWHYALPIWGALASTTQLRRLDTLQNKLVRKASNAPFFSRNQALRDKYNVKSADEVFNMSSSRLANSLAHHPNDEARSLILNPWVPRRLHRSRYEIQLETHVIPLQSLVIRPLPEPRLPTLIRLEQEEIARRNPPPQPSRPAYFRSRLTEGMINAYRRELRQGTVTREIIVERIQYQHFNIQRLVLSDFSVMEQRGPPLESPAVEQRYIHPFLRPHSDQHL